VVRARRDIEAHESVARQFQYLNLSDGPEERIKGLL